MHTNSSRTLGIAVVAAALLADRADAQDGAREVIKPVSHSSWSSIGTPPVSVYNNLPGNPKNAVPGLPGVSFFATTGTTAFDRPFGTANGNWILTALSAQATTMDEVLLVNGA